MRLLLHGHGRGHRHGHIVALRASGASSYRHTLRRRAGPRRLPRRRLTISKSGSPLPLPRPLRTTDLPGTPSIVLAIAGLRASCKEGPTTALLKSGSERQAPNLPQKAANENSHTLPFQTRFRAPSGHAQQCGGEEHQLTDLDDDNWQSSGAAARYAVEPQSNLVPTYANVCCHND